MHHRSHAQKEQGAALIMTAGFMLLAVLCLSLVVDTGRLYVEKRNLQRIADVAALEVASRRGCASGNAQAYAVTAATRNNFNIDDKQTIIASCGSISVAENSIRVFNPDGSTGSTDGVQITASKKVPASLIVGGIFGNIINLSASATAINSAPTVAFRIGSKLLTTNPSAPIMSLLKLVGVNLDNTVVASYGGLADVKITPSGLLKALGIPVSADISVGDLNELLAVNKLGVGPILNAIVTVAGQDGLLGANVELLSALEAQLGLSDLKVQLGTDPTINDTTGLFALIETAGVSGKSALDVSVDALSLLTATVGVATKSNGVNISLGGNDILTGLDVGVRVIEPQSIGIGSVGTKANNAQVRIHVDVDTNKGLTGILQLLGTTIKLPITIDTIQAVATVDEINCDTSPRTAVIRVDSAVANACIGKIPSSSLWSTKEVCATALQNETFVRLLGINLVGGKVELPVLPSDPEYITLEVGQTKTTGINNLKIGSLVSDLISEVLDLLGNSDFASEPLTNAQATQIADTYLALPELQPTGGGGNFNSSDLNRLQDRLSNDGVNWDRPAFIFTGNMLSQWRNSVNTGCYEGFFRYSPACTRTKLISSLQTDAKPGFLEALLGGLLGDVVKPLVGAVLNPVIELLKVILNGVGNLVANLLSGLVGLDLGRSDVSLDSISCGSPELVI